MLKFGTSNIGKVFAGTSAVAGVYSGNNLIWTNATSTDTVFNVSKITSNVYANSTTYNNCKFLGFGVIPFDNQTAEITYGGITKTVTGSTSTATIVYFGQYGAETDDGTPDTGDITFKNVKQIAAMSFNSAKSTTSYVQCINSVTEWGSLEVVGDRLFYNTTITSLTIGNKVKKISISAFASASNLTSITLPASVQDLSYPTSMNDSSHGLLYISEPFSNCGADIIVNSNNPYFSSENGILFDKNKTILYHFPRSYQNSSYTMPNSVTFIQSGAFMTINSNLTTINLNNVTKINSSAFYLMIASSSVTFNGLNNVTQFGGSAFEGRSISALTLSPNLSFMGTSVFTDITSSITFNGYIGSQTFTTSSGPFSALKGTASGISVICNADIPSSFFARNTRASSNNVKISSLTLNNVSHIGSNAFAYVDFLGGQIFHIGDDALVSIGTSAFRYGLVTDTSGTEVTNYTVVIGPIISLGNYALQTFHTGSVWFTTEDEAPSTNDYTTIFGAISSLGPEFGIGVPDQFYDQYYYAWEDLQPYITAYV